MHMYFPQERFGYHVVYDRDIFDAISFAEAHGFGYIVPDLMIPRFWPERFSGGERRRIREYAHDHGVSISFHAPSDYLSLITSYPEVMEGILVRMRTCLDLAEDLEAERFTIHPSRPLNFASAGGEGTYVKEHWGFYKTILSEGITGVVEGTSSVKVCLENDPLDQFVMEVVEDLLSAGLDLYLF
jgi:sugar phosphate isomerase/epimerase